MTGLVRPAARRPAPADPAQPPPAALRSPGPAAAAPRPGRPAAPAAPPRRCRPLAPPAVTQPPRRPLAMTLASRARSALPWRPRPAGPAPPRRGTNPRGGSGCSVRRSRHHSSVTATSANYMSYVNRVSLVPTPLRSLGPPREGSRQCPVLAVPRLHDRLWPPGVPTAVRTTAHWAGGEHRSSAATAHDTPRASAEPRPRLRRPPRPPQPRPRRCVSTRRKGRCAGGTAACGRAEAAAAARSNFRRSGRRSERERSQPQPW